MRILVLQFIPGVRGRPVPRFDPQLGTLLALLAQRGHDLALTGLDRFDLPAVKAALARTLPQLIYADISAVCVDVARRTFEHVQQHEFLPIVAGGQYASIDPAGCLSLPGVEAAALGEPDASLVTYFERVKDPAVSQIVLGVWLRTERGTTRPQLPPLVDDLDSLPFPHRDLFDTAGQVRRTGDIEIAVGRGCPQSCAYCLNEALAGLYPERDEWVRRRSPAHVLAELHELRSRYDGVRSVRFLDHAFTLDRGWLTAFLDAYRAADGLPFRCHVRANACNESLAAQLRAAGAQLADVEVISGSDFIRNDIFHMNVSGDDLRATFTALHGAGVATRAIVYLGTPYESDASLDETRKLLRVLRPTLVDLRPYYPWPGTPARQLAQEQGWLHTRGEEQFHRQLPGVDMPACRAEQVAAFIRRTRAEFPAALGEQWWQRLLSVSRAAWANVLGRGRP